MPRWTSASGRALVTSSPPNVIVPAVARTRPLSVPSSVDFPAPLAPTSAMSSAGAISRSIPNSTGPASKPALRPRTLSRGSGLGPFPIALSEVGLDHPLIRQHHLRLTLGQHATGLEHDRPVADPDDHAHHMPDPHHRDAGRRTRSLHVQRVD